VVVVVPLGSWQVGCVPADIVIAVGVPTVGVIVTVWFAVLGPLHPAALAVIMLLPLHPAA
jgi:hypothetical protein